MQSTSIDVIRRLSLRCRRPVCSSLFLSCLFGMVSLEAPQAESARLRAKGLEAVIVDNESWGEHRARYSGVAYLSRGPGYENICHPLYGGFNLENIFDREQEPPGTTPQNQNFLFEPRNIPMKLRQLSSDTVELQQSAGPHWAIENRTRFQVREPHYLDVEFECIPRGRSALGNFLGLFWATYVNSPSEEGYFFLGRSRPKGPVEWIRAYSQTHNVQSTFLPSGSPLRIEFKSGYGSWLWSNFSHSSFVYPFYYGVVKGQMYLLMLDRMENVRFSHSPTGGGGTPAWDFQFVIPDYRVDRRYGFLARIVVKKFISRADVIREYERWSGERVVLSK